MSKTATIRARIEPSLKNEVEGVLSELGLTASETIHLLYRQIKLQRGLPFEVRIPNTLTARVLTASKTGRNVKRFASKKALFADLGLSGRSAEHLRHHDAVKAPRVIGGAGVSELRRAAGAGAG